MAGSAVAHTDVWVALEYDRPWNGKAVAQSELSTALKTRLAALPEAVPGSRVQLIRGRDDLQRPGQTTLLLGASGIERPAVVRLALDTADALLELDVAAMVADLKRGNPVPGSEPIGRPVVLVCTNGKRDRCCAKFGLPIYAELAARDDIECWQTTHLGGHRFAPTLLCLPEGLCYGRLTQDDVPDFVRATLAGEVFEPARTLRGRTCLSAAGQAAEALWRAADPTRGAAVLRGVRETAEGDAFAVTLEEASGAVSTVAVQRRALGAMAHPSCAKDPAPVHGWFRVDA